jgi:hypothetical protein
MNVKSPNNTSKWQMGFNSAFKVLRSPLERNNLLFQTFKIVFLAGVPYNFIFVRCSRLHNIIPAFVTQSKGFENKICQMIDVGKEAEN